jgi:hypothetical protein
MREDSDADHELHDLQGGDELRGDARHTDLHRPQEVIAATLDTINHWQSRTVEYLYMNACTK